MVPEAGFDQTGGGDPGVIDGDTFGDAGHFLERHRHAVVSIDRDHDIVFSLSE